MGGAEEGGCRDAEEFGSLVEDGKVSGHVGESVVLGQGLGTSYLTHTFV